MGHTFAEDEMVNGRLFDVTSVTFPLVDVTYLETWLGQISRQSPTSLTPSIEGC
jgi:hypothetical protein